MFLLLILLDCIGMKGSNLKWGLIFVSWNINLWFVEYRPYVTLAETQTMLYFVCLYFYFVIVFLCVELDIYYTLMYMLILLFAFVCFIFYLLFPLIFMCWTWYIYSSTWKYVFYKISRTFMERVKIITNNTTNPTTTHE